MTMNPHHFALHEPPQSGESTNVLMMPSLLHETMEMILESFQLCELHEALDNSLIPTHIQTLMSNEMSRITMRLTGSMSWLLAHKAVASGQMTAEEAMEEYELEGEQHCLDEQTEVYDLLPDYLTDLLIRSHRIYCRVWHMDRQNREKNLSLF